MSERDLRLIDIAKGIHLEALSMNKPISVPNSEFRELLDKVIERGSLEDVSSRSSFYKDERVVAAITWLKIVRLPVSPDNDEDYDLFNRWQGVLSSLHEWGYRVYFMLQRSGGSTSLFIGVRSEKSSFNSRDAIEQIMEATSGSMPGIELHQLNEEEIIHDIVIKNSCYKSIGAVTGLPSFFDENKPGVLQTLDPLAFGIRGRQNDERDYSLLVIADPISDRDTTDIMNRMRTLGSDIHTFVDRSVNENKQQGEQKSTGLNPYGASQIGRLVGIAGETLFKGWGGMIGSVLGVAAGSVLGNLNKTISNSVSMSVTETYLDKFAQYAEQLLDLHIERMKQGRNLGYWNVGIYVLGKDRKDVSTVNGMLRSIYAGRESYIEPIRLHQLNQNSGALEIVRDYANMIPLFDDTVAGMDERKDWHVFGRNYQYLSTPMNTKEFALATSLPRCDVPGLRYVKTAVRFANNPPITGSGAIPLGRIVNMGVEQNAEYAIDHNDLVRHTLVVGATGSGKSVTCKRFVAEVLKQDVPALIIEPAKDDYVRWAIRMNEQIEGDATLTPEQKQRKKFRIYMPGYSSFEGTPLLSLQLCPFEPAAIQGAPIDMTARCENLIALINASLPAEDILPVLIDETVYSLYDAAYPNVFTGGAMMQQQPYYPLLSALTAMSKQVMMRKKYEEKVRSNLATCLETRFQYLTRGTRGKLLNVTRSTPYSELFDHPTVINISGISAARDKALIMSILMLSLYEYRKSKYTHDAEYRALSQENRLLHLTLVEEAHNILTRPDMNVSSNNPQRVVSELFTNMLSEIRSYGEGMMIVDQYPTRLIPDAIKNTNYKVIHRLVSPDDAELMGASVSLRDEQKALISCLTPGNAIVCGDRDDAASWVHIRKTDI